MFLFGILSVIILGILEEVGFGVITYVVGSRGREVVDRFGDLFFGFFWEIRIILIASFFRVFRRFVG